MLLEKVFEILKSQKKKEEDIDSVSQENMEIQKVTNSKDQEKYSTTFESNSDSGANTDKTNITLDHSRDSYSSNFESGTNESKPEDTVEQGKKQDLVEELYQKSHKVSGTKDIDGSMTHKTSFDEQEPDEDQISESQTSESVPEAAAPVPEPHPLAGDWNVLSTIEEVTTVDTETGQEDLTAHHSHTGEDTYKQSKHFSYNDQSYDMSEDGIQSLSDDHQIIHSGSYQKDKEEAHSNAFNLSKEDIESKNITRETPTVFSESTRVQMEGDDVGSFVSNSALNASSDISDSVNSKLGESNALQMSEKEPSIHLEENQKALLCTSESAVESLKISQNIEKDTVDIIEDIIEKAVLISEHALMDQRSITPNEFVALSIQDTDDDTNLSMVEEYSNNIAQPVSVDLSHSSHSNPAEGHCPDVPSITVEDTSTDRVRLSEGEVVVAGASLASEGELSASDGASLLSQSVAGLSGHLADSDSEPGEADRRLAGGQRRRLAVSLDTSSSSSWSEGEWRASPTRMRRFLNMAAAFRMIKKSDQE